MNRQTLMMTFTVIAVSLAAVRVAPSAADAPAFQWIRGGHGAQVQAVATSPDGQLAGSASIDGTVKLWRISDGSLRRSLAFPGEAFGFLGVVFSPDGSLVAGVGGGGSIWRV